MTDDARRRDSAIDLLRGLALLTITVNHLTGLVVRGGMTGAVFPTLSHWGFSSAAEIFFLLSGYLVGAAYLPARRAASLAGFARRVGRRALILYGCNAVLFALLLPLCIASPRLARLSFYQPFIDGGAGMVGSFLLLHFQPFCLEILATYVLLLLAAPLFAWGLVRRPIGTIAISIGLWAAAHQVDALLLPGGVPGGIGWWGFSPASWQLAFFGALAAGRFGLLERVRARIAADRRWLRALIGLFAVMTLMFVLQDPTGAIFWGQSKIRLGPLRLAHALVVCLLGLSLLWTYPAIGRSWLGRRIVAVGAASLPSFLASVAISYASAWLWIEWRPTHAAYLALCLGGIALLIGFGALRETAGAWRRQGGERRGRERWPEGPRSARFSETNDKICHEIPRGTCTGA